ncbi:diaminobutyrate--2-oxoglutarate transaminase [Endozoicomonas sp. ALB115]|uniref:diaminobutyrate--2-oxoglutarate transaminase n=1 Tax=Endozoicomonas sp. ALB115 TaxID=3403074 RepID=UPI003BB7ADF8
MKIFNNLESEVRSYCRSFPVIFSAANGAWLEDTEGSQYLDFFAGAGALNYGHNDPDMIAAVIKYLKNDGLLHSLDLHSTTKANFLHTFETLILQPRQLDYKVQFTAPTGSDAVEAAIKLARKSTGRSTIACFTGGYHGMSLGALSLTANPEKRGLAGISIPGIMRLPYENFLELSTLEQLNVIESMLTKPGAGSDLPAAFIIECVQGEGGLNAISKQWAQGVAQLAKEIGALLIVDDIQAGCGRTGNFFSFESLGIKPDIVCLSKSLSGLGLPFSVNLVSRSQDCWSAGEHIGTFRGNNLAMVSATVALQKYWSNDSLTSTTLIREKQARVQLASCIESAQQHNIKVVGRGMMMGLHFGIHGLAEKASKELFKHNLIAETCGAQNEILKLMPPLTIKSEEFQKGLKLVADVSIELAKKHQDTKEVISCSLV